MKKLKTTNQVKKTDSSQNINDQRSKKKDLILGNGKRALGPYIWGALLAILLLGGGLYWVQSKSGPAFSSSAAIASDTVNTDEVTYPVSMFQDGKVRHFTYEADGRTIRYFVLKSADGVIRSAFDACDVCWPEGKGYYQRGDQMICRNCGRAFDSVRVNEVKGGCNPAPLSREVRDNTLVIEVDDILAGKKYFDFRNRG